MLFCLFTTSNRLRVFEEDNKKQNLKTFSPTSTLFHFFFFTSQFQFADKKRREYNRFKMLDINLFRVEKGGNPELIRESQRRRFANVELVDEVIAIDKQWRQRKNLSLYQIFGLDLCFLNMGFVLFFFFFLGCSSIRSGESSQGLQQDQQASRSASNCESFHILSFVSGFRIVLFFNIRIHFISCFKMFVIFTNLKKKDCVNK